MTPAAKSLYAGYRFPPEIISHAVWLYFRFPLSLRMVEEMLAARGITVSHETVRQWARKFGQGFANQIRRRLPCPGDKWHLDEVCLMTAGQKHWLWRAVDQDGVVLDVLVQRRRDKQAAKRLLRKLLKRQTRVPRVMITDRFCQHSRHYPCPTRARLGIGPLLTEERTRMRCLACGSEAVTERAERTAQGYRRFRCRACGKQFNERSGTLLNRTQYPSDVIALVVLWRLRYKLSLRDLPEMFAVRGIVFSHEAVRDWEAKLTPALAENLRRRRRGQVGRSWYVDETYLKGHGRWCYLYRAIDRNGNLVDALFSEHRDMAAAQAFFRSAKTVTGVTPDRVPTDGHDSYPRAIRTELGKGVRHRTSAYLNNRLEQDHRGIKGRYRSMRGFKCPRSTARFCRAYDELRNFLRPRSRLDQYVPADCRRLQFLRRSMTVLAILQAA